MAKIGAFEQFMRIALGEHEIRRRQATATDVDAHAIGKRVFKLEFGGLAQQVCDKLNLSDEIRQVVKQAKEFRNYLAHNFWVAHFSNLHSARGIRIVVLQCEQLERQFDRVTSLIVAATGVNAAGYAAFIQSGANDEQTFREWESRLETANKVFERTESTQLPRAPSITP
jgi:hypothetical protein